MSPDTPISSPLVTVVTACLNAQQHIAGAIESVLKQHYADIDYVVVDGGSSDDTVEIVRSYESRFGGRLRWISEPDEGLYDAMNKGIALARGEIVGILNADDTYEPGTIEAVVGVWRARPDADIFYGDIRVSDSERCGEVLSAPPQLGLSAMRDRMILYHPATFVTSRLYRRLGTYDTRFPIAADYDFMLRCAEAGIRFEYVDRVLTRFSLQGQSNRDVRATDRDTTAVLVAHGARPSYAWALFYKRALAYRIFRAVRHLPGMETAYARYSKGRGR